MASARVDVVKLTAEAVAILASILLALAADAWWERAGEREREQVILADLEAEFSSMHSAVDGWRALHVELAEHASELHRIATGGGPLPQAEVLDSLLRRTLIEAGSFNHSTAVYRSILSTGELSLLQDDSLRYALASWESVLDDALEDEQWIFRDVQNLFVPYLVERLDLRGAFRADRSSQALPALEPGEYLELFADRTFLNLVLAKADGERVTAAEFADLLASTDQVLRLVRKNRD